MEEEVENTSYLKKRPSGSGIREYEGYSLPSQYSYSDHFHIPQTEEEEEEDLTTMALLNTMKNDLHVGERGEREHGNSTATPLNPFNPPPPPKYLKEKKVSKELRGQIMSCLFREGLLPTMNKFSVAERTLLNWRNQHYPGQEIPDEGNNHMSHGHSESIMGLTEEQIQANKNAKYNSKYTKEVQNAVIEFASDYIKKTGGEIPKHVFRARIGQLVGMHPSAKSIQKWGNKFAKMNDIKVQGIRPVGIGKGIIREGDAAEWWAGHDPSSSAIPNGRRTSRNRGPYYEGNSHHSGKGKTKKEEEWRKYEEGGYSPVEEESMGDTFLHSLMHLNVEDLTALVIFGHLLFEFDLNSHGYNIVTSLQGASDNYFYVIFPIISQGFFLKPIFVFPRIEEETQAELHNKFKNQAIIISQPGVDGQVDMPVQRLNIDISLAQWINTNLSPADSPTDILLMHPRIPGINFMHDHPTPESKVRGGDSYKYNNNHNNYNNLVHKKRAAPAVVSTPSPLSPHTRNISSLFPVSTFHSLGIPSFMSPLLTSDSELGLLLRERIIEHWLENNSQETKHRGSLESTILAIIQAMQGVSTGYIRVVTARVRGLLSLFSILLYPLGGRIFGVGGDSAISNMYGVDKVGYVRWVRGKARKVRDGGTWGTGGGGLIRLMRYIIQIICKLPATGAWGGMGMGTGMGTGMGMGIPSIGTNTSTLQDMASEHHLEGQSEVSQSGGNKWNILRTILRDEIDDTGTGVHHSHSHSPTTLHAQVVDTHEMSTNNHSHSHSHSNHPEFPMLDINNNLEVQNSGEDVQYINDDDHSRHGINTPGEVSHSNGDHLFLNHHHHHQNDDHDHDDDDDDSNVVQVDNIEDLDHITNNNLIQNGAHSLHTHNVSLNKTIPNDNPILDGVITWNNIYSQLEMLDHSQ